MKNIKLFLSICITIGFLTSCEKIEGTGPIVSEVRNVKNYQGLRLSICGQINFQVSPVYHVELLAQENILNEIVTKMESNDLSIKWDHPIRVRNCEDITVNITGPDLDNVQISGANDLIVTGEVAHRNLDLAISGSGNIKMQDVLIDDNIKTEISGSGRIYMNHGRAHSTSIYVSGSGETDLGKVLTKKNTSYISGSGRVVVNVAEYLEAHISGSGDVYYYGNPRVDAKVSGSGRVKQQ